ncbi:MULTISPECIES: hypothetical protein [Citrobacter]|uniref:hypothetical protein n=1 Tax=Citrobacter TaxID=544 RepID=UPI00111DF6C6|nr:MULTISPECIES: hypothetical protein [Citrobacter]EKX2181739.1 hypothetical protein [Citrobacter freundii]MBA7997655.1 hypothetical protein [Citrobacter freundii]MBJ8965550.1 hypothetical protein [Citrobacter freundii]MDV1634470.1 hypothetical protein [Citrobacter freundii]MDV1713827.1 hypothetical protein [Citrobacter freundii]
MPVNDIAVLIFTFIAACVFIFCAANIVVQLKTHDLKRLLQDDYDKARHKMVGEWEEANLKFMNEITELKTEIKAIKSQMVKKESTSESLSSAEVLSKKKIVEDDSLDNPLGQRARPNRLH